MWPKIKLKCEHEVAARFSYVVIVTYNSNLHTALLQRYRLHRMQTKIKLTIWSCSNVVWSNVAIATNYWNLQANKLQSCKLHRMQPKIGLKMRNCSNVAETLQLVLTIATSVQRRCNILYNLSIPLPEGSTSISIWLGITGRHQVQT